MARRVFEIKANSAAEAIGFTDPYFELALRRRVRLSHSLKSEWSPPSMVTEKRDYHGRARQRADFPSSLVLPALSKRAAEGLRGLIEPSGELLPTLCHEGEYYLLNVTTVLDVLDEKRSNIDRLRDVVLRIDHHAFKASAHVPPSIFAFKIPCRPEGRHVYLTHEFVERVLDLGLTGLIASEVGVIA